MNLTLPLSISGVSSKKDTMSQSNISLYRNDDSLSNDNFERVVRNKPPTSYLYTASTTTSNLPSLPAYDTFKNNTAATSYMSSSSSSNYLSPTTNNLSSSYPSYALPESAGRKTFNLEQINEESNIVN